MSEEIVAQMLELRQAVLIAMALTLVAWAVLRLCIRKMTAQGAGHRLAGLFVGLGGRSLLHFGAAWAKFSFFAGVLLSADPAQRGHYLLLAALAVLTFLLGPSLIALVTELVGQGLLLAGLAVGATLLRYLRQIRQSTTILVAYWLLAAVLILCAAAVLLREIIQISEERNYFDETGEIE